MRYDVAGLANHAVFCFEYVRIIDRYIGVVDQFSYTDGENRIADYAQL